jgi:hypothetical protein
MIGGVSVISALPARTPESTLEVMRAMVQAYAERPDVRRTAVVANAPLEPDPQRAADIDGCDVVIRCNSFVLDEPGAPAAVGRKVHVVVFNRALRAAPRVFDSYRDRLYLMVEPGRLHWEPDFRPRWWPDDLGQLLVPNREITIPLSDALGLPSRTKPVWATTGVMSAWIALTLFPDAELTLAGFSMIDHPDQDKWEHAWGDSCPVGPEHRIGPEGTLLRSWIDQGRARRLP